MRYGHTQFLILCGWLTLLFSPLAFSQNGDVFPENKRVLEQVNELDQLSYLLEQNPDNLELNYRYAQLSAKRQAYEQAIAAMDRMLIKKPDLHRIKLDLASLYLKIGSDGEAERLFNEVLSVNPPDKVAENIRKMLTYIDGNKRKNFLSMAYTVGWGVDNNQNSNPRTGAIDIFGISSDISSEENEESQLTSSLMANHSYIFDTIKGHRWQTSLSHYKAVQESSKSDNITVNSVKTGPLFYSDDKRTQYGFSIGYADTNKNQQDYLKAITKEAFIRYLMTPQTQISASYKHTNNMYQNTESITVYENQNGCTQDFELQLRSLLTPKDIFALTAKIQNEHTRVDYETNMARSIGASYTKLFGDGYYLNTGATFKTTDYQGADILVDSSTVRRDSEKTFTLGIGKNITENISCALAYIKKVVNSNIQNYGYDNDRLMATLTWRY